MNSEKIRIREQISVDLALRDSASALFNRFELLSTKEVIIDFKGVKSISRSFAHEYITKKKNSSKNILEINIPENVRKMFDVVKHPKEKTLVFDLKKVKAATL